MTRPSPLPRRALRRLRRAVLAHRRGLASLCAVLAVGATLRAHAVPPPPRVPVLVAAHDLGSGALVTADDLVTRSFTPESVPAGTLRRAALLGRTTAAPVRAGEPLTDVRLVGPGLLAGYPGAVAVPVRIGDPAAVRLLEVGDRVDVLAADPQGSGPAAVVAAGAPVVALPRGAASGSGTDLVSGALVVLAVPDATARRLAGAAVSTFLSVTLSR